LRASLRTARAGNRPGRGFGGSRGSNHENLGGDPGHGGAPARLDTSHSPGAGRDHGGKPAGVRVSPAQWGAAMSIVFPRRGRGRPSAAAEARYAADVAAFCRAILKINSVLLFSPIRKRTRFSVIAFWTFSSPRRRRNVVTGIPAFRAASLSPPRLPLPAPCTDGVAFVASCLSVSAGWRGK